MKVMIVVAWVGLAAPVAAQVELRSSLKDLEAAVRSDSNDAQLHYDLGVELARRKNAPAARLAFTEAVRIDPKLAHAWVALIRLAPPSDRAPLVVILGRDGRLMVMRSPPSDSMQHMMRRVFLLNPLLDVYPGERYPMPTRWKGSLSYAMRAFRDAEWQLAAARFDSVIAKATRSKKPEGVPPFALWYHALTQVELGRYDSAVNDLLRMLDVSLRDTSAYGRAQAFGHQYTLAYLHQLAGNSPEAARIYRGLLEDQLGLDLGHAQLASALEGLGRWDEAVAERRNAVNANPDDPSLLFDLGVTLHNAGYSTESAGVLEQALAANPRETRAHFVLGAALRAQGKTDQARQAYTRFLKLAPGRMTELQAAARRRLAELPGPP